MSDTDEFETVADRLMKEFLEKLRADEELATMADGLAPLLLGEGKVSESDLRLAMMESSS